MPFADNISVQEVIVAVIMIALFTFTRFWCTSAVNTRWFEAE